LALETTSLEMKLRVPRLLWIGLPTTVLVAIAVGLQFGIPAYQQLRAIEGIRNHGRIDIRRVGPTWLRMVVGEHQMNAFDEVQRAYFSDADDSLLLNVRHFRKIKALDLSYTSVTDGGIEHICNLRGLLYLDLDNTAVSDASVPRLKQLSNLKTIRIFATDITDAGASELQRALPGTTIHR
jgi:hypothetical protein